MSQFLLYYQRPNPATWVYLSSFLTIGLYFVFHRFWSIRNADILLLILLGPGVLMVHEGRKLQLADQATLQAQTLTAGIAPSVDPHHRDLPTTLVGTATNQSPEIASDEVDDEIIDATEPPPLEIPEASLSRGQKIELRGFLWLLLIEAIILVRLFCDPMMVRRPLLDPNLTTGGLAFIGVSLLIFLLANVITSTPRMQREQGPELGPGYPVLNMLPAIPTTPDAAGGLGARNQALQSTENAPAPVAYAALARTLAIFAHLAVVFGITLVGHWHFGNFKAGAGCATLYLMLPYTAQMTGRVDHVLPAALLVWAILMYRKPLIAGVCLGLAAGLVYYPAFLLPLWFGFYRQRGLGRFAAGVGVTILLLTLLLSLGGSEKFFERLVQMYGLWLPLRENLEGVWGLSWQPIWRFPILVAFMLLAGLYAVWPRQKNLGTLMSCSAAIMVAAQFWHGFGGGMFIAWFLPLMLLTIFRPNLEDRVALKVIGTTNSRRSAPAGLGVDAAVVVFLLGSSSLVLLG